MHFLTEAIIIFFMLVLNGLFAAYEMAIAATSRTRIETLVQMKRKGAVCAAYMKDRLEGSLAVIQVGITLAGAIAAAVGGAGVKAVFAPWIEETFFLSSTTSNVLAITFFVIPLSGLTIVFAELIPKVFALHNKEYVLLKLSPVMKFIAALFFPVIYILEHPVKRILKVTRKPDDIIKKHEDKLGLFELRAAAAMARASRVIGAFEEKIVASAGLFSLRKVSEILLPVADIVTVPVSADLTDTLIRAHMNLHTRFPVCEKENDPQTIIGYITFKDIVCALKFNQDNPSLRTIMRPIKKLREDISLAKALEDMIHNKDHIAIVTNAADITIGMITMEDLVEELLGDIEDEFDRLPAHAHPLAEGWLVGGGMTMDAVLRLLGKEWPQQNEVKIPLFADWVEHKLGNSPRGGERFQIDGLDIQVRKIRRRKLSEAIVTHASDEK